MENKETMTDFEKMKDQMLKLATDTMQNGRINVNERKAIIRYIDEINRKIPDDSNKNLEISEIRSLAAYKENERRINKIKLAQNVYQEILSKHSFDNKCESALFSLNSIKNINDGKMTKKEQECALLNPITEFLEFVRFLEELSSDVFVAVYDLIK